ncbi:MAG: aldo/keto reductase [Candidatus Latescibacteria bacterium]|jgi:aryl-alcohol dehydrogenase-like predicted oxidoreductase|nr:aldo/keto reductase [Candidatus Latescibacterota bacterium]
MEYTELGTTGQNVSAIALGCMSLTHENEAQSRATVIRAYGEGITFFDTADVYSSGESEEVLGAALKEGGIAREDVVIASKCGIVFQGLVPEYEYKAYDLSGGYIKASVEASLKRLGTDYIDLFQPHRIDYLTHPEETARAFEDLKSEGKVRHVGVSNYTTDEIRALSAYTTLSSLQTQFSLLHLEPIETGLIAICQEKKMNVLCWSPNHRGVLAKGGASHSDWQEQRELGVVAQVSAFAERYGWSMSEIALVWLMQLPGGIIPLVGTANPDHIAEAANAVGRQLERDDWYELMVIARGRPMPWGQRPYAYLKER